MTQASSPDRMLLTESQLQHLIDLLQGDGFETIAPKIEQAAIVYGADTVR